MTAKGYPPTKIAKRLPSCVNESETKYKVRRTELPVKIYEYFKAEHESKPSVVCSKIIQKLVSACLSKTITSKTQLK